jgi:hypothetical protein
MATNCNVEESPARYTCSRRNGVGEAVARLPSQCANGIYFGEGETHVTGGCFVVQL